MITINELIDDVTIQIDETIETVTISVSEIGVQGIQGIQGAQGIQGIQGETGAAGVITLTTTGTSGAATLTGSALNIPQYSGGGGGAGVWGGITGTLSAQTDLNSALSGKVDTVIGKSLVSDSEITRLSGVSNYDNSSNASALAGKQPLATILTNTTASFTTEQETKLSGIATGATSNSSDATLLTRANHTGAQLASTISDIQTTITNNTAVLANTTKISFDSTSSTRLANTSGTNTGDQDLSGKVDKNTAITGATKTKITYDTNGLVITGADATTADIADSTDKRYQTDNQKLYNDATSSIQTQLNGKQDTLESTVNIKSINGTSILGIGDLVISSNDIVITGANSPVALADFTGSIVNTIVKSFPTPAGLFTSSKNRFWLRLSVIKWSGIGTCTIRVYFNTTESITNGSQVLLSTSIIPIGNTPANISKTIAALPFSPTNTAYITNLVTANTFVDYATFTNANTSTVTFTSSSGFLMVAFQLSNASERGLLSAFNFSKI